MAQGLKTPPLTQLEFKGEDFDIAERMAKRLGYDQTVYTSTSALWGLFCLPENPEHASKSRRLLHTLSETAPPFTHGCIIKTRELGFLFVQNMENLGLDEEGRAE